MFQEDEEANVISNFNGLLVITRTRGIRVDCTLLHGDMTIVSIDGLISDFSEYTPNSTNMTSSRFLPRKSVKSAFF